MGELYQIITSSSSYYISLTQVLNPSENGQMLLLSSLLDIERQKMKKKKKRGE
ncbi:MAG: hypothetical protein ACJ71J_02450 [Nitrososphaeraceae archaeon]